MKPAAKLSIPMLLLLGVPEQAWAGTCALCRQALASGGNQGLIRGFYWSILLIAGVPLLILGMVGWLAWRGARSRRQPNESGCAQFYHLADWPPS